MLKVCIVNQQTRGPKDGDEPWIDLYKKIYIRRRTTEILTYGDDWHNVVLEFSTAVKSRKQSVPEKVKVS